MTVSTEHRLVYEVPLEPVSGSRFQPTGFPDIGPAVFRRPGPAGAETVLLVESAQSMANRLEASGWDPVGCCPRPALGTLPWIEIRSVDGEHLTSSRTEAHRLASAFLKDATFREDGSEVTGKDLVKGRLGLRDDRPLVFADLARRVASLDPLCLLHGVFFADKYWPGQPKVARALAGFVEATGVERAESGGVKRDHVRHNLTEGEGGTGEGYGTVPFHRTEWTAREIIATFVIDRDQIRSYGLGKEGGALLEAVAQWEIRTLLDGGLRFRTACDLHVREEPVTDQGGAALPPIEELTKTLEVLVGKTVDIFAGGAPLVGTWRPRRSKNKPTAEKEGDEEDS